MQQPKIIAIKMFVALFFLTLLPHPFVVCVVERNSHRQYIYIFLNEISNRKKKEQSESRSHRKINFLKKVSLDVNSRYLNVL